MFIYCCLFAAGVGFFVCKDLGLGMRLISGQQLCNGVHDCLDGGDESVCGQY